MHVLIMNQHGDNRGDEAALRAMLCGIEHHSPVPVTFTILHQFAKGAVTVELPHEIRWIHLVPRPLEALRILLFAVALALGVRWRAVLGCWGRSVADAYADADIAVSAPGGPYFGDPYIRHELLHWFYVWLADRHGTPTMLYAPSVGPFEKRFMNVIRRCLFRRFHRITVREEISKRYLTGLLAGQGPEVVQAMDSALQRPLPPFARNEYFHKNRIELASRLLVGVSVIPWRYPGHPDPVAALAHYERVVLDALEHLHSRQAAHLLLVPQLYGPVHADTPYLEALAARLSTDISWEIVDPMANSDHQQRVFGMASIYFASRYHPQVFAVNNAVPGVCIYYEHKSLGFIRRFGLDRFAFPIDNLDKTAVIQALDEVIDRRTELSHKLATVLPELREAAAKSSRIAVEMFPQNHSQP